MWLSGEEPACSVGDRFDPWVRKIPWRRKWLPTPVFLPGESHGQRSLVGYSPWGSQKVWQDWATDTFMCVCIFGFYCHTIIKYTEGRETAGHVTHAEDGMPTYTERYSRHREKNHWHNDIVCMSARHQLPKYRYTEDTSFDNCDNCSILHNYEDHFGLWELSQQLCVCKIEACYSSWKFSLLSSAVFLFLFIFYFYFIYFY